MARQTRNDKWPKNILRTVNRANCVCIFILHTVFMNEKKRPEAPFRIRGNQSFLPPIRPPKRFWKRSIRPPVSMTFCLPV